MKILRTVLPLCLLAMVAPACSSAATPDCAAPALVTASMNPMTGESAMVLWNSRGEGETVDAGPTASYPVMSPDGRMVAFVLGTGLYSDSFGYEQTRVALFSLNTREVTPLSANVPASIVRDLEWFPDGSEVAFIRGRADGSREIAAVRVDDLEERKLFELAESQGFASFSLSPDGRELLLPTDGPLTVADELRRYSISTGGYNVVETPHATILDVAWSPDGRMVAMEADIPGTDRQRLFAVDIETGQSQAVDRRRGGLMSTTWSGTYLFYTYQVRVPGNELQLMRWDSTTRERVELDRPNLDPGLSGFVTVSAPSCASAG